MIMKTIKDYLVILVSLALVFGGQAYLLAAEEASSIMCDDGVVNIGDMDVDVQDKCGQPDSQNMNEWVYNFGPSQPVYTVIFNEGKVVRILEDESGN
jgi:hypothetical protein